MPIVGGHILAVHYKVCSVNSGVLATNDCFAMNVYMRGYIIYDSQLGRIRLFSRKLAVCTHPIISRNTYTRKSTPTCRV